MSEGDLHSWKEIAAHLGTTVRSAQRWEQERGLPVRRLPGGSGRVVTTKSALDAWQHATKHDTAKSRDCVVYRFPLGRDLACELKLTGAPLTNAHLQRLRQYLDLLDASLHQ